MLGPRAVRSRPTSPARSVLLGLALALVACSALAGTGFLSNWNDGASKARIVAFVESVTDPTATTYVPPAGARGLLEMVTATHGDVTSAQFSRIVADWLATARHPRYGRPHTELAYVPMTELRA